MRALAASCEELRARTGNPPLTEVIRILLKLGSHQQLCRRFSPPDKCEWVNSQPKVWNRVLDLYISKSFACHSFSHIRQEEKNCRRNAGVNQTSSELAGHIWTDPYVRLLLVKCICNLLPSDPVSKSDKFLFLLSAFPIFRCLVPTMTIGYFVVVVVVIAILNFRWF